MIGEFLAWWARHMAALASPLARRFAGGTADAFVVARDADAPGNAPGSAPGNVIADTPGSVRLTRRRKGRSVPVGIAPFDAEPEVWRRLLKTRRRGEPLVLSLTTPLLIRRTTLPLAARANLDRVLGYEMDRLTPFPAGEVFFTCHVLGQDRARGQLEAELVLVPRAWVAPMLDRLRAAGAVPETIEAPGPDAVVRLIPLAHPDPARAARVRSFHRLGWIACAGLAVAVLAVPVVRQSVALAEAEDRVAELRPRVEQADALRKRIAASTSGAGQLAAARHRGAETLRTLALLTEMLPDDTHLVGLTLRQHRLTMEGQSAAATKLIGALAAEPRVRNPSFAAPVLRSEAGTDIFTIQAEFGS